MLSKAKEEMKNESYERNFYHTESLDVQEQLMLKTLPEKRKREAELQPAILELEERGSPCLTDLAGKYYAFGRRKYSGVQCDKSYLDYSG